MWDETSTQQYQGELVVQQHAQTRRLNAKSEMETKKPDYPMCTLGVTLVGSSHSRPDYQMHPELVNFCNIAVGILECPCVLLHLSPFFQYPGASVEHYWTAVLSWTWLRWEYLVGSERITYRISRSHEGNNTRHSSHFMVASDGLGLHEVGRTGTK